MSSPFAYDSLFKQYSGGIPCPSDFNFATHIIDKWARANASLPALHFVNADFEEDRVVSYGELSDLSHRAARVFSEAGLKKGDRVLVQLPRCVEWYVCVYGLIRLGAVPIPGTSLLLSKDLAFRASSSRAVAFIGCASSCPRFEEIASSVSVSLIFQVRLPGDTLGRSRIDVQAAVDRVQAGTPFIAPQGHRKDDLALLYFTSGTTSLPKLVHVQSEMLLGHTISGSWYKMKPNRLFLCLADLGWAKALYAAAGAQLLGGTLFVQPPPAGNFSATHLLETLHRYPIQTLCAPPTIYRALVTTSSLECLRKNPPMKLDHAVGAGEPLNASVIRQFAEASGVTIKDGYGQSETVIVVANFEGVEVREGSMGKAAPFFQVGIIDHDGRELGDDQEGEIAIRTDVGGGAVWIFKGYEKNGKLDPRQRLFGGKSWYPTGDRAVRDKDGYFTFVGRDDDVITSSGYRIGPFEVESGLKAHPAVAESAAVGSPDLARGEVVKAFVVLSDEYRKKLEGKGKKGEDELILELQNFFKSTTAPYKVPREIEFVDASALPKTVSGKIRRVELRELEKSRKADVVKQIKSKL